MSTTEQILDEAGQILADPRCWYQNWFHSADGKAFCAVGAIGEAYRRHGILASPVSLGSSPAVLALVDMVKSHHPGFAELPGAHSVTVWNDAPQREHVEIIEMFEKASAYAAEKGL